MGKYVPTLRAVFVTMHDVASGMTLLQTSRRNFQPSSSFIPKKDAAIFF
jgi:hypothetical protein